MSATSGAAHMRTPSTYAPANVEIVTTEDDDTEDEERWRASLVRTWKAPAINNGTVNQTTCDRIPAASPAQKLAAMSARLAEAARISAWTATAAASPVESLSGLAAVNQ